MTSEHVTRHLSVAGAHDGALARIAAKQHGVFTAQQLIALGFSEKSRQVRLNTGRWIVLYDNVYRMGGAPSTWRSDLLAACWAVTPTAVASHRSAAALWELPAGKQGGVEITCQRWRRTRHRGLVVHESKLIEPEDRDEVDGIPCTSASRTLFDLARPLGAVMLDANIDNAIRRKLVTLDELEHTSTRLATKGRPGGRRFRAAVDARTDGTALPESVPERLLADLLVRQGLPAPVHQYVVRDAAGSFVARVDLAYPEWMIVIEYDSVEHHTGTAAHIRDSMRRDAIGDLDFTVLTATVADLNDRGERLGSLIRRRRGRAA